MKREWKPGDVAMVNGDVCLRTGDQWEHGRADRFAYRVPEYDARPLVVIDPEDREQVERLLRGYAGWATTGDGVENYPRYVDDMQAALREFASPTPPRCEEPTGLGAVVEDEDGVLWVRAGRELQTPDHWRATSGENLVGWWATWERVAAVRILSPGYTEGGA